MTFGDFCGDGTQYLNVQLRPGEIHVAMEPTLIETLLGSCISVCLYSIKDQVGAMSHSVLPCPKTGLQRHDVRYVESAIGKMMDEMKGLGVTPDRMEAKVFGGAEMFHRSGHEIRFARIVGDGNTAAAKRFLDAKRIRLVSECVGGNMGRKIIFNTATGVALVRMFSHRLEDLSYGREGRVA